MASNDPVEVPLACSLNAAELRVRGEENASLFARAQSVHELPDGYRFTFPAGDDEARDVLAFVLAERACCPFFTFELTFPSPHQAIELTVRGREGVKEIVEAAAVSTTTAAACHADHAPGTTCTVTPTPFWYTGTASKPGREPR